MNEKVMIKAEKLNSYVKASKEFSVWAKDAGVALTKSSEQELISMWNEGASMGDVKDRALAMHAADTQGGVAPKPGEQSPTITLPNGEKLSLEGISHERLENLQVLLAGLQEGFNEDNAPATAASVVVQEATPTAQRTLKDRVLDILGKKKRRVIAALTGIAFTSPLAFLYSA